MRDVDSQKATSAEQEQRESLRRIAQHVREERDADRSPDMAYVQRWTKADAPIDVDEEQYGAFVADVVVLLSVGRRQALRAHVLRHGGVDVADARVPQPKMDAQAMRAACQWLSQPVDMNGQSAPLPQSQQWMTAVAQHWLARNSD